VRHKKKRKQVAGVEPENKKTFRKVVPAGKSVAEKKKGKIDLNKGEKGGLKLT